MDYGTLLTDLQARGFDLGFAADLKTVVSIN